MEIKNYRDLIVWQKSMDLAEEIYILLKKLPKEEMYALANQMRRAAVSIPSNIAEGHTRKSTKEYGYFLSIAQGSKAELETQLQLCNRFRYLSEEETTMAFALLSEISKMITTLIRSLEL
ncbi:MAG: four helix bundle protein [Firmicutes bacterium]|nr:four helix bundle protein [Bacillota bacterium]